LGQKVHPKGLRLGIIRDWDSKWFADKDFRNLLHEDLKIRKFIKKRLFDTGVAAIEIERAANRLKVTIQTAKPGMVIGRGGTEVERLRQDLEKLTGRQVAVNILEIKLPELSAQLVAENVAAQLERRIAFRRAIKQSAQRTMRGGALGVKIMVSGRLGGAELSRTEWTAEGSVPLHTLRADIDYGFAEAFTTYGQIGVKVWIYRGEILRERERDRDRAAPEAVAGGVQQGEA
jgi:small subunit ribosomal protein S3